MAGSPAAPPAGGPTLSQVAAQTGSLGVCGLDLVVVTSDLCRFDPLPQYFF